MLSTFCCPPPYAVSRQFTLNRSYHQRAEHSSPKSRRFLLLFALACRGRIQAAVRPAARKPDEPRYAPRRFLLSPLGAYALGVPKIKRRSGRYRIQDAALELLGAACVTQSVYPP